MVSRFWSLAELVLSVFSLLGGAAAAIGIVWCLISAPWPAFALIAGGGAMVALHQGLDGWLVKRANKSREY
jgi:hypothetical protein